MPKDPPTSSAMILTCVLTSAVVVITPGAGVLFTVSTGLAQGRGRTVAGVHLFPLGGIAVAAAHANALNGAAGHKGGVA